MMQHVLQLRSKGRSLINITDQIEDAVKQSSIQIGLCNVFLHHTSASLILCENSDILVQQDLERFMGALVPDGDQRYEHIDEGPDDMPSHVRTILTQNSISIPITANKLKLGRWQGVYVWEHRLKPHDRTITLTLLG